jgi:hypothetical protein
VGHSRCSFRNECPTAPLARLAATKRAHNWCARRSAVLRGGYLTRANDCTQIAYDRRPHQGIALRAPCRRRNRPLGASQDAVDGPDGLAGPAPLQEANHRTQITYNQTFARPTCGPTRCGPRSCGLVSFQCPGRAGAQPLVVVPRVWSGAKEGYRGNARGYASCSGALRLQSAARHEGTGHDHGRDLGPGDTFDLVDNPSFLMTAPTEQGRVGCGGVALGIATVVALLKLASILFR